ncbi:MAG: hypothetical protein ACTSRA_22260, partial [Promethearchaeota archaeon]
YILASMIEDPYGESWDLEDIDGKLDDLHEFIDYSLVKIELNDAVTIYIVDLGTTNNSAVI